MQRVKEEAWGGAFMCTACGNGRQNPPSTEKQVKNRVRTGICVCAEAGCAVGVEGCVAGYISGRTALHICECMLH